MTNREMFATAMRQAVMKEALIIIDVQNDYFPGGTCELVHPYEAEKVIRDLIAERNVPKP